MPLPPIEGILKTTFIAGVLSMSLAPVAAARSDTMLPSVGTQASDQEEVVSCYVFVNKPFARAYRNPGGKAQPEESDLKYTGDAVHDYLALNKRQCEQFKDGKGRYFAGRWAWYAKADFVLKSQLTPIERWTTSYVYEKSADSKGEIAPDAMTKQDIEEAYAAGEIEAYNSDSYRGQLTLFSPDGYWVDGIYSAKLYLLPSGRVVAANDSFPNPSAWTIGDIYEDLRCSQTKPLTCGYRDRGSYGSYSDVARLPEELKSVVQVRDDKIVITRRLSYRWPFKVQDVGDWVRYGLFGEFSDPMRPLVYAPGVLFKPDTKPNWRHRYRPKDMVQEELCVANCPDQLPFQQPRPKPVPPPAPPIEQTVQPPAEKPGFFSRLWSALLRWFGL
ncbi:hypothetical protein [Pseudoxanthomonas putridarboris]